MAASDLRVGWIAPEAPDYKRALHKALGSTRGPSFEWIGHTDTPNEVLDSFATFLKGMPKIEHAERFTRMVQHQDGSYTRAIGVKGWTRYESCTEQELVPLLKMYATLWWNMEQEKQRGGADGTT